MGQEAFALAVEDGAKVLIVEDNDDVRSMLSTFLGSKGYAVTSAAAAVEGVSAAVRTRPDLILMDLGLPDADGLSAVRAIRSDAGLVGVPILIVTAYDTMQFRAEAVDAGCVGYMVKPVDPQQLLETVKLFTGTGNIIHGASEAIRDEGTVGRGLRRYPPAHADVP
jgi:DNA-binding response OmpR family regulator